MSYLGTPPQSGFITTAKQRVTSSTNAYVDLDHAISSIADVIVFVNFVKQDTTNLTLTTSTRITLGATLVSSDIVEIHYLGKAVNTQTPGTATVTNDMLAGSIANDKLAGSIANSKLATDPTNASNLASGTVPTARLGSGTASSSTFLRGDSTFAEAGGGATEFISSVSVTTTVSTTGFGGSTFSSTYDNYYFILHNILNGIDDQPVYMRFRDTSGNVLSASEYDWVHVGGNTSGTQVNNNADNDSSIQLLRHLDLGGTGGNSNANKGYVEGIIFSPYKLSYASNDNQHCSMVWRGTVPRSTYLHTVYGSATFTNGTQLGGFQIYGGGGGGPTYTDRFEGAVYGIKRS